MAQSKIKDIGIAYDDLERVPISSLHDFQGDLKELSEESFAKLSKEIIKTGFAFAPHAWKNPKDKRWYLVDGHQRIKTIRRLMNQSGFRVPKIPIVPVRAKSYAEAKRRVLQAAAQFGEINPKGLATFMKESQVTFDDFKASFEFPTIEIEDLGVLFEENPTPPSKEKEPVQGSNASKIVHTCPGCGLKFSSE